MTPQEDSGEVHMVRSAKEIRMQKSREEHTWGRADLVLVVFPLPIPALGSIRDADVSYPIRGVPCCWEKLKLTV